MLVLNKIIINITTLNFKPKKKKKIIKECYTIKKILKYFTNENAKYFIL